LPLRGLDAIARSRRVQKQLLRSRPACVAKLFCRRGPKCPSTHALPSHEDSYAFRTFPCTHHDAEADVVIDLEAREAAWQIATRKSVPGWTYNGQVPGPDIDARVGDTVVVRFKNALPEPTLIHWHGLQIPAAMDGTDIVQRPVAPGETFEYRSSFPTPARFGITRIVTRPCRWNAASTRSGRSRDRRASVDREQVLVLDDIKLNWFGGLAKFGGRKEAPLRTRRLGETAQRTGGTGADDRFRQTNAGGS